MSAVRVGVFGAGGRMGTVICDAVAEDPALELVAAVDPAAVGEIRGGVVVEGDAGALTAAGAEVAIEFTRLDAARENLAWCAANGVHAVVGTSGFTEADHGALRGVFTKSNCVIAPNFAIGAVLMMRFAELAAPFFETATVIELHHDGKVDAPSGTALSTVERMAASSAEWAPDPTTDVNLPAATGGMGPAGIRVHSIRMRGMVAHQEVLLGTTGQTLSIRHDTTDRTSFLPGVLLAAREIQNHPGLTVGLDAFLGL